VEEMVKDYNGDRDLALSNLGYMIGYMDEATRRRWYGALPQVSHPIFGVGFGRGEDPTPQKAFEMGQRNTERGAFDAVKGE